MDEYIWIIDDGWDWLVSFSGPCVERQLDGCARGSYADAHAMAINMGQWF